MLSYSRINKYSHYPPLCFRSTSASRPRSLLLGDGSIRFVIQEDVSYIHLVNILQDLYHSRAFHSSTSWQIMVYICVNLGVFFFKYPERSSYGYEQIQGLLLVRLLYAVQYSLQSLEVSLYQSGESLGRGLSSNSSQIVSRMVCHFFTSLRVESLEINNPV